MKPGSPDDPPERGIPLVALEVAARYSPRSGRELEISGSRDALLGFATSIELPVLALRCSMRVPAGTAQPYDGFLSTLRIEERDDSVQVAVNDDTLCIRGRRSLLAILAKNVRHVAGADASGLDGRMRYHAHVEYYPGHFFLTPDSIPLIITQE